MTQTAYAFVGLTAVMVLLVGVLGFAAIRFAAAARNSRRYLNENQTETAFVAAALQETLEKLKAQEREMTARAEASERLSEEIVESLTAGLFVVDGAGRIGILNPAGRRLLRLPASAVSREYRQVLAAFGPLAAAIEEGLSTGRPIVRRKLEIASGGSVIHLGVTVSPLSGTPDRPHGVICLFTDLTPIIEMEDQLRLKDSLARVGELTAGIAHEFRNGLATIHGYARLIDLDALPAAYRAHVEGIRQETDSLGQVVTNFLNFARPEQVTFAPVDLRAIVERAADELGPDARARGGDVTVRGELPPVEGDEVLLKQAFSNLLRNAVEACAGASTPPHIIVDGRIEHGHARVSVDDNGPGVAEPDRDRIFQPFFTTKGHGTGLGLALVQKIVVTHNGRIHVARSPQGGASFQVALPLAAEIHT